MSGGLPDSGVRGVYLGAGTPPGSWGLFAAAAAWPHRLSPKLIFFNYRLPLRICMRCDNLFLHLFPPLPAFSIYIPVVSVFVFEFKGKPEMSNASSFMRPSAGLSGPPLYSK